jgi:putative exporter of polyketide antibiotics
MLRQRGTAVKAGRRIRALVLGHWPRYTQLPEVMRRVSHTPPPALVLLPLPSLPIFSFFAFWQANKKRNKTLRPVLFFRALSAFLLNIFFSGFRLFHFTVNKQQDSVRRFYSVGNKHTQQSL